MKPSNRRVLGRSPSCVVPDPCPVSGEPTHEAGPIIPKLIVPAARFAEHGDTHDRHQQAWTLPH